MRKAGVLAFIAGIALVVMAAATPAYADPPGNNGTVKIHAEPGESEPIMANEPHVCAFHLHGFNFDASSTGTWSITAWPPTGDGSTVVRSGNWGPASSTGEWRTGAMTLADGHYKLAWQQTDPAAPGGAKQKVFWVDCSSASTTGTTTATTGGTTGTNGTTAGTTTGTTGEETSGTTTGTTGEETTGTTTGMTTTGTTTGTSTSGTTTGTTGESTTGTTGGSTGAVTTGTSTAGTTGGAEAATTGATTGGAAAATTGGGTGGTEAASTGGTAAAGVSGVPNLPSTSTSSDHAPLTLIGLALMLIGAAIFLMRRVAAMR